MYIKISNFHMFLSLIPCYKLIMDFSLYGVETQIDNNMKLFTDFFLLGTNEHSSQPRRTRTEYYIFCVLRTVSRRTEYSVNRSDSLMINHRNSETCGTKHTALPCFFRWGAYSGPPTPTTPHTHPTRLRCLCDVMMIV